MPTFTYEGILAATEYNIQASLLLFYIFEYSILGLILHPCTLFIITNSKQDTQRPYKRNIGARSRYHYCRGKALSITYSEVVSVSFVIQFTKRMHLIVLLCVPYGCTNIFPQYLINHATFGKKKSSNIKRVFWFSQQLLSEIFLILRGTERDVIIDVCRSSCKVGLPVIIVRF